ncbi:macro domain-containing protein lmo2759-like isoform X2 [Mercenaria mercenaria]|uniref:macro domain-containing protein lmo2759-like isoform X1 n=1 Tax=Mercenaria mercenaria TaxID=6596 RepID=UPI00234FB36D|nr:macro domain-containing protein lmo2759-like isoform X1 [Mercenaria mercenaria]XP_053407076.1 macro domain-containing protein lmo2759-like isoform X2 [Mercenaria mercenaria]
MSIGNATSGEWVGEYPNEKYVFSIKNTYVYVCEASITDVTDVDVIINATNDKLASGAGVAAVIARKAGIAVTNECSSFIRDNGALPVTENFVSTAGYLPFKGIIHVVGPTWSNYTSRQKCAKDLFHTVINALTTARSKGWSKVAFPAISSGKSGVPKQLCAEMYVMALADFALNGPDGMKEVHFVDTNREMIDLVCGAQEKWYKNPRSLAFENASNYRLPEKQARRASQFQGTHTDAQADNLAFAVSGQGKQPQRAPRYGKCLKNV